ncbi:MAG: methyltransferase domain-containing protein [Desulforhopalus sp.]|nr:methyltransferase domain-containing protein [Desulforhopalus sp.]
MSEVSLNRNPVGKRIIPDDIHTREQFLEFLRHLFPYEHVKDLIEPDQRVIEIGFGEGYGTHILSTGCLEIVALEIEPKVISHAREKYRSDNSVFKLYDGSTIPLPDESFDVAVSFQVIEHVDNDVNFVSELHRVLKNGGRLYLTTPNRSLRLKPGERPFNRYHKREYYHHELESVLRTSFRSVSVFGVSASESIRLIEIERLRRGPFLSLILRLGLHRLLPSALETFARRLFLAHRRQRRNDENLDTLKTTYSLQDFYIERSEVDTTMDLFAFCQK